MSRPVVPGLAGGIVTIGRVLVLIALVLTLIFWANHTFSTEEAIVAALIEIGVLVG